MKWLVLLFLLLPTEVQAKFKGNFDISLSGETGNSRTRSFAVNNSMEMSYKRFTIKSKSNSFSASTDHVLVSERYLASEQIDWRYRDHPILDYFFQRYAWDKARAKNIKSRSALGFGHGFHLYKKASKKFTLFFDLGGDYTWEERRDTTFRRFGSLRNFFKLNYQLSDKTTLYQDFEYLLDSGEGAGYRINTLSSIQRNLKASIGLKLSFQVNFDSTPATEAKMRDTLTNLFLVVEY